MMNASRASTIVLAVSLALNAFLAAFAITVFVVPGLAVRAPATPALRTAARALDHRHRAALIALLRADGRRLRPQTQAARRLRREAWGAFQAPRFDATAAKAALAQGRALNLEARATVEDDLVDFAAALPASERAALGQALLRLTKPVERPAVSSPPPGPASPAPGSSPAPRSPG
jgi:uncharacterized membrane protein